ncbi:DUF4031 domain-containing protein [Stenotrophomonas maltophilia]|uniref:DUF4031 domain-containing protein n=1 Tax=Stenotrophomonas maltophilia TaxID=40324 RepID=UPI000C1509BD|nr:DUF4031 domain-containing protein [Stenotrophomonas maltophilia]
MTVYVDQLQNLGLRMSGRSVLSSRLFSDSMDLGELHALAERIGLRREWFRRCPRVPHYVVTENKRRQALLAGVLEVDEARAKELWRVRRGRLVEVAERAFEP